MTDNREVQSEATPEPAYQFGMKTLFFLPLFVVFYFAIAHWLGVCLAVAFLIPAGLSAACFYPRLRAQAIRLLVAYVILAGFVALTLPIPGAAREAARRSQCHNSMKSLSLALNNYHDTYGSFPPAYVADDKGRPIHSWRVLILPFVGESQLYNRYRFEEPWNSPHNMKLVSMRPSVFRCPSENSECRTCTSYVAVIGPHTTWRNDRPVRLADVTDGACNTWAVVEVADSGITWTEPRDLHVLQMAPGINAPTGQGISSSHPGGAYVVCIDGSVHFVSDASCTTALSPEDIRSLLTIDRGDTVATGW